MRKEQLDETDKIILDMLQTNAKTPLKEMANRVYLSTPAVSARIDRMEKEGYITGYHAQINPVALGYHIKAFIHLEVLPEDKKDFYPFVQECRNVIECNCVTGDYSMVLEVLFPGTVELDQFIGELQRFGRTKTLIVFSTSVEHRGILAEE
ncbi:MAG TPA: Lrp/AsnC family transcriptional regulator [Candidatus Bariatricus faecipullorum]|nr:Lrp/AsnC family transcriptional regulator [Candidatus Bariatricus faecipullorum]